MILHVEIFQQSAEVITSRFGQWNTKSTLTAFYDWLYLSALRQASALAEQLLGFDGFTDIEFNPERSLNCQAAATALYVALSRRGELEMAISSRNAFLERLNSGKVSIFAT